MQFFFILSFLGYSFSAFGSGFLVSPSLPQLLTSLGRVCRQPFQAASCGKWFSVRLASAGGHSNTLPTRESVIFFVLSNFGHTMASVIRTTILLLQNLKEPRWNDAFEWCFIYNGPFGQAYKDFHGPQTLEVGEKRDKKTTTKAYTSLYLIAL